MPESGPGKPRLETVGKESAFEDALQQESDLAPEHQEFEGREGGVLEDPAIVHNVPTPAAELMYLKSLNPDAFERDIKNVAENIDNLDHIPEPGYGAPQSKPTMSFSKDELKNLADEAGYTPK